MEMQFASAQEQSTFFRNFRLLYDDLVSYADSAGTYVAIIHCAEDEDLVRNLDVHAVYWNAVLAALQNTAFISLARIHDSSGQAYLKPLLKALKTNASSKCKDAAMMFEEAIAEHKSFISQVLKLRNTVFAHTSHEKPLYMAFGFEGLTLDMFELYWDDMAAAMAAAEGAVFSGAHAPEIDVAEFKIIVAETNVFLDTVRGNDKGN